MGGYSIISGMLTTEQQIFEQIKKAQNILITFSKNWNGDAIGSAIALLLFLKKLDKNAEIAAEDSRYGNNILQTPKKLFSFLPEFQEIKNKINNLRKFIISLDITNAKVSQIKYKIEGESSLNFIISPQEGFFTEDDISSSSSGFKYDLVITLDTPDLESLGKIYDNDTEFFYKTPKINIDNHSNNEEYGQINLIELTSVSTSEILFSLFENYSRELIDEDIATCLLTGIISKTKSFKTPNITPRTLNITSQLISMGARREEIVNRLYRSRNINVLKLWGRVLARLSSEMNNRLIWSTISSSDFLKTQSREEDLNEVIDELIVNIPEAGVIVLIYEKGGINIHNSANNNLKNNGDRQVPNKTNALVYSVKNTNSLELIKDYNPIGTNKIAYTEIDKPLEKAEKEVITTIRERLKKLPL